VQEWDAANPASSDLDIGSDRLQVAYTRGSGLGGGIAGLLYTTRDLDGDQAVDDIRLNHYNTRGDVVAQTDQRGYVTYQAAYEAFGESGDAALGGDPDDPRTQSQGTNLDRQRSNTKDRDPTGLINEGMRYRKDHLFLTRDPLGFVDGPNMYAYVVQNPWTMFDPQGLAVGEFRHMKGNGANIVGSPIYNESTEYWESPEGQAEAKANLVAMGATATLVAPGPEDAVIAGALATKGGQALARFGSKFADDILGFFGKKADNVATKADSVDTKSGAMGSSTKADVEVKVKTQQAEQAKRANQQSGQHTEIESKASDPWSREPETLQDQMTLDAARRGEGETIIEGLGDDRFKGQNKVEYKTKSNEGRDSVVHYVENPKTKERSDFKFKKHSNDNPTFREKTKEPNVPPASEPN